MLVPHCYWARLQVKSDNAKMAAAIFIEFGDDCRPH